jgi:hypothetical protein
MTIKYFIYKTTHKNGKYYVGRHYTDDLDDGYIGSGKWPRSIKDKSTLTREILEFADDIESLILLEGKYLAEHFGKPGCMNGTSDPIGWNSENNPMKDPAVVAQLSGDNHWTKKEKNKSSIESLREKQIQLVDDGTHNLLGDSNPNKDGRNAKLAMERGTHVYLSNNPSVRRSKDGTHQMFRRDDGSSIGGDANSKRVSEGTHNWLGGAANDARIEAGTHNFLGSSQNERMLAEGKHPSQQKVSCGCCGWTVSSGMFKRWHADGRCHMNPSSSRYNPDLKQR